MESRPVTTSQKTSFLYEIQNLEEKIPEGKLQYFQERLRNNLYNMVMIKFLEHESSRDLTQADLARRIGYDPGRLSKLLGAPGNWTIKTISDLLAGIAGEELLCETKTIGGGASRNCTTKDEQKYKFNSLGGQTLPPRSGSQSKASVEYSTQS